MDLVHSRGTGLRVVLRGLLNAAVFSAAIGCLALGAAGQVQQVTDRTDRDHLFPRVALDGRVAFVTRVFSPALQGIGKSEFNGTTWTEIVPFLPLSGVILQSPDVTHVLVDGAYWCAVNHSDNNIHALNLSGGSSLRLITGLDGARTSGERQFPDFYPTSS